MRNVRNIELHSIHVEQDVKHNTERKSEIQQRRKSNLHKETLVIVHLTVFKNVSKASPDHSYSRVPIKKKSSILK